MADAKIVLSAVDQTKAAIDSAKRNLAGLGDQAAALPARFGSIGLALSAALSAVTLKGVIDTLDGLDDMSEKTGIAVESLASLRYAGEVSGTSFESLAAGVRKLSANMSEAARGGKEAAATFATLGVRVTAADGSLRAQDEVLGELADKFASYADGTGKAAIAQRVFGKSGDEMIPLLNLGSVGIARLRKEAQDLGAVYGGDLAKEAATFNDNLRRLGIGAEAAKVSIVGSLLPGLNDLVDTFVKARKEVGNLHAVLISLGGALAKGFGVDDLGTEMRKAKMQANAMALLGKQIDLVAPIAERGDEGAKKRLGLLRAELERLQADALKTTANLKATASEMAKDDVSKTGVPKKKPAPVVPKPPSDSQDTAALSYLAGLAKEYSNLTGAGTKLAEVQEQLNIKGAKFTEEQARQAREWANKIDAFRNLQRVLESDNRALEAQAGILERNEDAVRDAIDALRGLAREQREGVEVLGLTAEETERVTYMRQVDAALARAQAAALQGVNEGAWDQAEAMRQIAAATRNASEAKMDFDRVQADKRDRAYNADRGVSDAIRDYRDNLARTGDAARDATQRTLGSMEDALTEFATTGKLSVRSLVDTIIAEFTRLRLIRPLMADIFGNAGVGTGLLGRLFGSSGVGASASGGFWNEAGGLEIAGSLGFHSGGVVGLDAPTFTRNVPANLFEHATRYHTGGLVGDEVPAILQKGEGVFTREQMKALGGGGGKAAQITFAPVVNVDSRSDRAQVISDVTSIVGENNRRFMEQLRQHGVVQ